MPAKDSPEAIGGRIAAALESSGITRAEFVRLLNKAGVRTNYNHSYRWTRGEVIPSGAGLQALAKVLNVSESWILRGADGEGPPEFRAWLQAHAPGDLTAEERLALAAFALPGQHPGPLWYTAVLTAWRMGTGQRR
jgi:transcriptional regulator with XRE-family HTH domain